MKPEFLYKSTRQNYPGVDMMYRTNEGLLYGLQVTRQKNIRKIRISAVDDWLNSVGFKDLQKVRIVVIPSPRFADELRVEYEGNSEGYPELEVWQVPPDYNQQWIPDIHDLP